MKLKTISNQYSNPYWHIFAIIFLACLLRIPTFALSAISGDEAAYALVAREILQGNWPFSTAFDHKPIALYLHFSAIIMAFGDNPVATRLLSLIFVTLSALLLKNLLHKSLKISANKSTFYALFYILVSNGLNGAATNTEHFINFYILLICYCCFKAHDGKKYYYFMAGLLLGITLQTNYLAGLLIVGFYIGFLVYMLTLKAQHHLESPIKSVLGAMAQATLLALAGFIISFFALLIPIYLWGDLAQYFDLQIRFLEGYKPTGDDYSRFLKVSIALFFPLMMVSAYLVYGSFQNRKNITNPRDKAHFFLFATLFFSGVLAAGASGRYYPHYFLLALPAGVLWLAIMLKISNLNTSSKKLLLTVMLISALIIAWDGVKYAYRGSVDVFLTLQGKPLAYDKARATARRARPYIKQGDMIYVVCAEPVIYQLLNAKLPTKFAWFHHHYHDDYAKALGFNALEKISQIIDKAPKLVIVGNLESCEIEVGRVDWIKQQLKINQYKVVERFFGTVIYTKN